MHKAFRKSPEFLTRPTRCSGVIEDDSANESRVLLVWAWHAGILKRRDDSPQKRGLRSLENRFQQTLDLCRSFERTFAIRHGTRRESAITHEFPALGACAEKRAGFRDLSQRHLSVV